VLKDPYKNCIVQLAVLAKTAHVNNDKLQGPYIVSKKLNIFPP